MNPTLIFGAVCAAIGVALGGGAAWQWQAGNITKLEYTYAQKQIADTSASLKALQDQATRYATASVNAQKRADNLAVVASRNHAELVGLRSAIAQSLQAVGSSLDAALADATTKGELLTVCSDRYSSLAEKADGHVNDLQTLIEAWPK